MSQPDLSVELKWHRIHFYRVEHYKLVSVLGLRMPSSKAALAVWTCAILCAGIGIGMVAGSTAFSPQAESATPNDPKSESAASFDESCSRTTQVSQQHIDAELDQTEYAYSKSTFQELQSVLFDKKQAIISLLTDVEQSARSIVDDQVMRTCFETMAGIYAPSADQTRLKDDALAARLDEYRRTINQYYALNYRQFYDILMVSPDRFVYFSIRKESDYHQHIPPDSVLGQALQEEASPTSGCRVVDYHHYGPSGRPSAFFIIPVTRDEQFRGWVVLQYEIRMLDALLVDQSELGRTGEVYLVNRDHRMLTDSRFSGERTHLKYVISALPTDDPASGQGMMADYRGIRVFLAYDSLHVLGQLWTLVAQIDEAEVIANFYHERPQSCLAAIESELTSFQAPTSEGTTFPPDARMVEMDSFQCCRGQAAIETRGVSTCTAVVVTYPGRFAYLAHISPYDKIYGQKCLTNIMKQLVSHIKFYDIRQCDLRQLEFIVVANHLNSIEMILDKLFRYGIVMDQVRFAYQPRAQLADIWVAEAGREVLIRWHVSASNKPALVINDASAWPDLASVLRESFREE
jgi:hypothetical protein